MSDQQAPSRPWFRLASISRPAPQPPTPTPEPAPALPRSTTIRPAFRPRGGASSVPTSPVSVGRGSQPSSPSDKKPTTEVSSRAASVSNSPVKTAPAAGRSPVSPPKSAKTSSLPSSPAKSVAITASVPSSPAKPVAGTTATVPTSAAKTVAVATTASVPTSPAKTASPTTSVTNFPTQKPATFTTTKNRVASPQASVPTIKPAMQSPVQSPKIKTPTAPPPSPLTLPPPQMRAQTNLKPKIPVEAEQKTVLVQKMIDKPKGLLGAPQKDLDDTRYPSIHGQKEPSKQGEKKEKGNGKKFSSDSEDSGMRVITIAGENKGAFMELIKSPHRNGFQGSPHRLQKTVTGSSDGSEYHSYSSGEEGDRKMKGKSNGSNTMPMNAFMNSNVQGVNNSIAYNSSCTHHDPGVHLSLHRKPTAVGLYVKERSNGYNS